MTYLSVPKVIVLGIDGLEYDLVEKWDLKNIMQKTYGKLDLSDYSIIVTPLIWGSILTGKIDQEVMKIWVRQSEILGGRGIKRKWWTKFEFIFPLSVNFWIWEHFLAPLFGGDAFDTTANYVIDKKESNIFQFFKKSWTNGIPGYGVNISTPIFKKLILKAVSGEKMQYREYVIELYKNDKFELFSHLKKQEYDLLFWYTRLLDNFGHIDMDDPLTLMKKYYLEINEVVGKVKEIYPNSVIYVISDHGMEPMNAKKDEWGIHSDHGFFSSSTGEIISKPFNLYELISKYKNKIN